MFKLFKRKKSVKSQIFHLPINKSQDIDSLMLEQEDSLDFSHIKIYNNSMLSLSLLQEECLYFVQELQESCSYLSKNEEENISINSGKIEENLDAIKKSRKKAKGFSSIKGKLFWNKK